MIRKLCILIAAVLLAAGCAGPAEAPAAPDAKTAAPLATEPEMEDVVSETDETEPVRYDAVMITVRRDAKILSERAVTSEEEIQLAQEIVFDYMLKSAAWEGVETSELENCIILSFDWTADSERQSYCQYDVDGKHVLQAGEAGMYTVMSDSAYEKLLRLAGLSAKTGIGVEAAVGMLERQFGEKDAATGNTFSFGYVDTLTIGGKDYYHFRISWLVDEDHMSYLTDYLVAADGSEMQEYIPTAGA